MKRRRGWSDERWWSTYKARFMTAPRGFAMRKASVICVDATRKVASGCSGFMKIREVISTAVSLRVSNIKKIC